MKPLPILSIIMALGLGACNTLNPTLITTHAVVVLPPAQMMTCPVTNLPDAFQSNKDVAKFIVSSHSNNVKCKVNMDSVKEFLTREKTTLEAVKP